MATTSKAGMVNARTVVLRSVDSINQCFTIYTDKRSLKVQEITDCPKAVFVFWSPKLNWQLRIYVEVSLLSNKIKLDEIWQPIKNGQNANDYLSVQAPGDHIDNTIHKCGAETENHFMVLVSSVQAIDWLELSKNGHRRATLIEDRWQWLVP